MPLFFINNKRIRRYIDTLNLHRNRILVYDITSYPCIDIKLHPHLKGKIDPEKEGSMEIGERNRGK
jgi:hypothetical protein